MGASTTGAGADSGRALALAERSLGGFVLRDKVGAGGFGDVYLAEQVALHREAIVKVLRREAMDEIGVQRFLREAQLASRLDHPYAAHVYAFGAEPDGLLWIAMERVRGASLRAVLEAQGPMPLERLVPLLERICEVVHTAHEQGIIHRDLKPDNVMVISRAGRLLPKLLDFGIARAVDTDLPPIVDEPATADDPERAVSSTTERGSVLGSPPYMAPEVWADPHGAGPAADQYALAALAYEALTGRRAFKGKTVLGVARAHARTIVEPLGNGFANELDLVIRKALAKRHPERYSNVLEFAQAFRAASGLDAITVELPQIEDELRVRFLTGAPQPVADSVAAYNASRNAHQAREAMRGIVRVSAWYVGILALACRTRVGSGAARDSERARVLLRDLHRQGLPSVGWIALAKQLTLPFARLPDTYPLPELVLLLHPAVEGTDAFGPALEGTLADTLADSSEEAASQAIARELPIITALLRALEFVLEYALVVPRGDHADSWMGTRGLAKRSATLRRQLPEGRPVVVEADGAPLLAVWPLIQVHVAVPGHTEQMFMLAGPGRGGARLVSTPHDFEHRDDELWDWFRAQLFADDDAAATVAVEDSPYRGLSSYTRDDAGGFFGRERETEVVVNRLKLEAFVAIVGPSGVGKSSFVHAGVAPSLAGWRVITARPGRAPIAQLGIQLGAAGLEFGNLRTAVGDDLDAVADRLRMAATEAGGVLIVIDQFEELFTLGSSADERALFVRLLLAPTRTPADPLRVAITLRDDFLIRAQQLPGLDHALARGLQLLGPLGPAALERIVVEPARRAGYELDDPDLAHRMVAEAGDTPAAVALISFTAARLWELRDRHFHQLSKKAYDAIGGVGGALARHADETVDAMPAAQRALVRKAFRHLVTFEGTRAVFGRDELAHLLGGGGDAVRLIEGLITARLVTSSENERGDGAIEIVHEALIGAWPRLAEWRREDVEGSRFHEQLRAAARQWEDRGRVRGLLWRGDALAEYQLWRKRHSENLTPIEAAFGASSVADALRGTRIRRAVSALALIATAVFIAMLWRANRNERALLRDSTLDQGRLRMLQGEKLAALAYLDKAYHLGETGPAIRLMIEEALRPTRARVATLEGHTGRVVDVAYSSDGTRIATASGDGTARIWDAATGAVVDVIHLDGDGVTVAFSPDSKLLAVGGRDPSVRLWDVHARKQLAALSLPTRDMIGSYQVMFSPDGTHLVATGGQGLIRVWSLPLAEPARDLASFVGTVGAAFSSDGTRLAVWDNNGNVAIFDAHTFAEIAHVKLVADEVETEWPGAIDRTGALVAIATGAGELDLVRADGTVVAKPGAHAKTINAVAFSPNGALVATASADNTAQLWDVATGKPRTVLVGHNAGVTTVRFSPNGEYVVTGSTDGSVRLWSGSSGAPLGELDGHTNYVGALAFRPDSSQVVTASFDHRAIIWDVAKARQFRPLDTARVDTTVPLPWVRFSADGHRLALLTPDGSLVVSGAGSDRSSCRAHPAQLPQFLALSADGQWVATVAGVPGEQHDDERVVRVWNGRSCALVKELQQAGPVFAVAFSPDGKLVVGGLDTAWLWDVATAHVDATYSKLPGYVTDIGFHPDGDQFYALLYTADAAASLALQDLDDPARRRVFAAGHFAITGTAFDRARHLVIASSFDQYLWIWDEQTGKLVDKLEGTGSLWRARLSSDGALLVGVGGNSPTVWDANTRTKLGILEGHSDLVVDGGFIGDRMFVTASRDGTARVWDLATLRPMLKFGSVEAIQISPQQTEVVLSDPASAREWMPSSPAPDPAEIQRVLGTAK